MPECTPQKCYHIDKLPKRPTASELASLRKGLRRRNRPQPAEGWFGQHGKLGEFRVLIGKRKEMSLRWKLPRSAEKTKSFAQLCESADFEKDRLELGWLIADFFWLQGAHIAEAIPDPNAAMRESNAYFKQADDWRHWAVVPAGFFR